MLGFRYVTVSLLNGDSQRKLEKSEERFYSAPFSLRFLLRAALQVPNQLSTCRQSHFSFQVVPLGPVATYFELQEALHMKCTFKIKPAETTSEEYKRIFNWCSHVAHFLCWKQDEAPAQSMRRLQHFHGSQLGGCCALQDPLAAFTDSWLSCQFRRATGRSHAYVTEREHFFR